MPIVNEREKSSVVDPAAMDPRYFGRLDPDLKRIGNADPDASGQKWPTIKEKDVFLSLRGLEASPVAWMA
jgi:hypothetical protein